MNAKRILLIDDLEDVREMIAALLTSAGYIVLGAENGEEGLKFLQREAIDLVILNWQMPIMGGDGVLASMAKDHRLRRIPVLVSTETPSDSKTAKATLNQYRDTMNIKWQQRPFDPNEFRKIMKQLLEPNS